MVLAVAVFRVLKDHGACHGALVVQVFRTYGCILRELGPRILAPRNLQGRILLARILVGSYDSLRTCESLEKKRKTIRYQSVTEMETARGQRWRWELYWVAGAVWLLLIPALYAAEELAVAAVLRLVPVGNTGSSAGSPLAETIAETIFELLVTRILYKHKLVVRGRSSRLGCSGWRSD